MTQEHRPYTLPRHSVESERLNLQHQVITGATTYVLHPRIKKALPSDARIADVATGTGVWMQALSSDGPSTWSFTGFDVSDGQFPPSEKRGRCSYEVLDAFKGVPEQWQGAFDVVHIRYMTAALSGDQWGKVAATVHQLLKPGGWIQWHEGNFGNIRVYQNEPDVSIEHEDKFVRTFIEIHQNYGKLLQKDIEGIPVLLKENGFTELKEDIIKTDRAAELRQGVNQVGHKAMHFALRQCAETDPSLGMTGEQADELANKGWDELKDGKAYICWDMRIVTGRKV